MEMKSKSLLPKQTTSEVFKFHIPSPRRQYISQDNMCTVLDQLSFILILILLSPYLIKRSEHVDHVGYVDEPVVLSSQPVAVERFERSRQLQHVH